MESHESMSRVILRAPSVVQAERTAAYKAPTLSFLQGTWHVTHSTLPMWKSKRNVRITYTPLAPSSASTPADETDRLDDLVTYQGLDSDKEHTVRGVDTASGGTTDTWDWRGKGWLMIASSHWEVLGWGDDGPSDNAWVVTYFAKTLFTPAGLDIYSRQRGGIRQETLHNIKTALADVAGEELQELTNSLFEVTVN